MDRVVPLNPMASLMMVMPKRHASPDLDLILEKYDGVPRERPRRWSQKIEVKRIEAGSYGQKTQKTDNPAGGLPANGIP